MSGWRILLATSKHFLQRWQHDAKGHVYTLEPLTPQTRDTWDAMLRQCPEATAFQSIGWRDAVSGAFRQLTPNYWLLTQQGAVIGGLPAFIFQPIPGIRLWHSLPWNLCGGLYLTDPSAVDPESLIAFVEAEAQEKGWCEVRWTLGPEGCAAYGDLFTDSGYERTDHFTHLLKTDADVESLWRAYNKRVRGAVRKAEKSGVKVVDAENEAALTEFYAMYLATLKGLGGTPKPRSLMQTLLKRKLATLALAHYDGACIAGLLYLRFNRTVTLWCEASVPAFLKYRPNNAIFHHIIARACREGYEWVDFGASPPARAGLIAHKEQYRAVRTDFASYTKVISPLKRAVWTKSEGIGRRIYTWMQS